MEVKIEEYVPHGGGIPDMELETIQACSYDSLLRDIEELKFLLGQS